MPKGYWIVRVAVRDAKNYPTYLAAAKPAFEKYNARFVVRGGKCQQMEGVTLDRNVVVEFADFQTAVSCYESAEYTYAKGLRQKFADADFLIVEGVLPSITTCGLT